MYYTPKLSLFALKPEEQSVWSKDRMDCLVVAGAAI